MIRIDLRDTELLDNGLRLHRGAGIFLAHVDRLRNDPNQPRKDFNPESLASLRADIDFWRKAGRGLAGTGFLEAISCRWAEGAADASGNIKPSAKLIIWDGERRWRATKDDYEWLPVVLDDLSAKEARSAALRTSIHKALLLPIEEAHAFAQEMKEGETLRSLGKKLSKDKSYIENRLNLLKLPDDVQHFVSEHPDKMSHGLALRDVTDREFRTLLINAAEHGAHVRELQGEIQKHREQNALAAETRRAPDAETQERQSSAARNGSAPVSRGSRVTAVSRKEATEAANEAARALLQNLATVEVWRDKGAALPKNELVLARKKIDEMLGQ